jgi:hypothetical protein
MDIIPVEPNLIPVGTDIIPVEPNLIPADPVLITVKLNPTPVIKSKHTKHKQKGAEYSAP